MEGLFCHRCGDELTGRKLKWCSLACKRDHETEQSLIDGVLTFTRKCRGCGLTKPLSVDFYKTPTGTYRRNCRACVMQDNKTRDETKPEVKRAHHLMSLYGITTEEYELMLRSQQGKCATCYKPPTRQRLCVDHDHRTKKIRGLLCGWCNLRLIGKGHNAELFYRAADYLTTPPAEAVIGERFVPAKKRKKRQPRKRK